MFRSVINTVINMGLPVTPVFTIVNDFSRLEYFGGKCLDNAHRYTRTIMLKLDPKKLTVLVDSREQRPWNMEPMPIKRATLATGDYTLAALRSEIAIERKSLDDLLGCIGSGRDRFERELVRLRAFPLRAVIVEANWGDIETGAYRSKVHPNAALGSILGWMSRGIPFYFAGRSDRAAKMAGRMMFLYAKRRHAELLELNEAIRI